jgi:hypothetical protein
MIGRYSHLPKRDVKLKLLKYLDMSYVHFRDNKAACADNVLY